MTYRKKLTNKTQTGQQEMFFDAHKSKPSPPLVRPIEDQEERESQRLWQHVVKGVNERDHDLATDEKTRIEDRQREEAAARAADGVEWTPRLFRRVRGGPGGSEEGEEDLEWVINANMYVLVPMPRLCLYYTVARLLRGYLVFWAGFKRVANTVGRNHDADPATIAEQIKAIYPIVKGQKPDPTNSIPAHAPSNNGAATRATTEGNLIDL